MLVMLSFSHTLLCYLFTAEASSRVSSVPSTPPSHFNSKVEGRDVAGIQAVQNQRLENEVLHLSSQLEETVKELEIKNRRLLECGVSLSSAMKTVEDLRSEKKLVEVKVEELVRSVKDGEVKIMQERDRMKKEREQVEERLIEVEGEASKIAAVTTSLSHALQEKEITVVHAHADIER